MLTCQECGAKFPVRRWKKTQRFCSGRCSAIATAKLRGQGGTVERKCKSCGARFNSFACEDRLYCSAECSSVRTRKPRPRCEVCGKPVRLMRNRYCSRTCRGKAAPRPGFTSWTGFYIRAIKANPGPLPCVLCGAPGRHRHHPNYGQPELILWLCISCHRKLHGAHKRKNGHRDMPPKVPLLGQGDKA